MGYPPQGPYGPSGPYQPQPGQGYGQPQQGGYQQGPPQGYQQPQGYAPPGSGGGQSGYDFGAMYGQADMSRNLLEKDRYPAVVEEAGWDLTKDGTKGAWTIVFRTTAPGLKTGQGSPGTKLTMTMSVSPTKNNGEPNPQGLGIMYRQLGALGIPIPPDVPFWQLGWTPQQVAQAMAGRPCIISVTQNEWDGGVNNKVRDIQPPQPGQPVQVPQTGQAQASPPGQYGTPPQPGPGSPYGGQQQAPQPWQQPQAPQGQQPYGGPGQGAMVQGPGGGTVPSGPGGQPWQQQQGGQPGQGYNPAVPPYAQQAQPGQGGTGQFTPQGQALQPGTHPGHAEQAQQYQQPPNGYVPQPGQQPGQQPPQGQQGGGAPAPPPWAQPQ